MFVTRPEPEASRWAAALRERGWPAQAWPLMAIGEPSAPAARAALAHWRAHWPTQDALMFVSAQAVRRFFAMPASSATPTASPTSSTRFWAPGPGTAQALADALGAAGLDPARIDAPAADAAQFDSEHLWPVVRDQLAPGRRVLVVRGDSAGMGEAAPGGRGREWLIERCREAGASVQSCAAYERRLRVPDPGDLARWRQALGAGQVWLLSSSESLQALEGLPAPDPQAVALVTHPRIAAAARVHGFAQVIETRPTLADVARALESWAHSS